MIMNIFIWMKLKGYKMLLSKIDEHKVALENQQIPKFRCATQDDCLKLLNNLGFDHTPEKEELANLLLQEEMELDTEGKLTSSDDIMRFNQIVQKYLMQKPGFFEAAKICSFVIGSSSNVSPDQFAEIINTISQLRKTNTEQKAKELLTMYQFERYLSPDEFNHVVSDLVMNPIWLISDDHENSTEFNNAAFVKYVNSYAERYSTTQRRVVREFKESDLRYAGQYLAEFLTNDGGKSYTGKELDEIRCFRLLQNSGLLAPVESGNELAHFLIDKKFTLSNYAHLSTDAEKICFNALVLEFLNNLAEKTKSQLVGAKAYYELTHLGLESEKRIIYVSIELSQIEAIMEKLRSRYSEKPNKFKFNYIDDAYKVFIGMQNDPICSPVTTSVASAGASLLSILSSTSTEFLKTTRAASSAPATSSNSLSDQVVMDLY